MSGTLGGIAVLLALIFTVGKSASWAVRAAISLSRSFGLSEFVVSFLIVTVVSVLPEAIVSVLSALRGVPALGLGTLLGSNVADLAFVFGTVAILARRELKVESTFIKKDYLFLAFLLVPLALGFTGHYSRIDGALLVASGLLFLYLILQEKTGSQRKLNNVNGRSLLKSMTALAASLLLMGTAAHFTIQYAVEIAGGLGVTPALVGLLVVALGTTLPELLFSVRAAQRARSTSALGDILGTVIADVTLVLGVVALIHPFSFNPRLTILTGFFMLLAGIISLSFLRSQRTLTRPEGALLLAFYAIFVITEFILRDWTPLIGIK